MRKTLPRWIAWVLAWAGSVAAARQDAPRQDQGVPDLSPAVLAKLEAPYLTDAQRREARIFHGVWREDDLAAPADRARAALIVARFDDPALADPAADPMDRAESLLARGELTAAIELAAGDSLRAILLRASALDLLGRRDESARAIEAGTAILGARRIDDAAELTAGARLLMLRTRVVGQDQGAGADFRSIMSLLGRARGELDLAYWPAMLAEAELLAEKDNRDEARNALAQVLALNPRSAAAWALVGELAVDAFDMGVAGQAADRLDAMARGLDPRAVSLQACLIRARAALRQSDADGAELALAPALDRFPESRPSLALEAAILAKRFDPAITRQALDAFEALSPGAPDAELAVGIALSEARQYAWASEHLREAARRSPYDARIWIELGLLEVQAARDREALEALTRAVELDPFNIRAANSLTLVRELMTYASVESEHFIVRHAPGVDAVLAREMLPVLEGIFARVCGDGPGGIDHQPPFRTTIDLMPDHRWFSVRIAGVTGIHTMAAATGPAIAMESPRSGPGHMAGPYDWPRVLQHEFTHTVTLSRTNNRIPHWFTEAAAVYLEDSPRDDSRCQLLAGALQADALFDLETINIAFVRPSKPTDRAQAYAQGHWMYEYIIERWGPRAPLDLMDLYAQGQTEESAMRAVLRLDRGEFLHDFTAWARTQVESWGLAPGKPSIDELLLRDALADKDGHRRVRAAAADYAAQAAWALAGAGPAPTLDLELDPPSTAQIERWAREYPAHADVAELAVQESLAVNGGRATDANAPLIERYAHARPVDSLPHRLLARHLLDSGRGEDAVPHLEFLDAREQHSAAYAVELARLHAAAGRWEQAAQKAERATRIAPFDPSYRELAATAAIRRGALDDAERHLKALAAIEPDRPVHQRRLEALATLREKQDRAPR